MQSHGAGPVGPAWDVASFIRRDWDRLAQGDWPSSDKVTKSRIMRQAKRTRMIERSELSVVETKEENLFSLPLSPSLSFFLSKSHLCSNDTVQSKQK